MKYIFILTLIVTFMFAQDTNKKKNERDNRIKKQIEKEIQREKKYSKERTFYQSKNYDFKGAQVNPDSLGSVPDLEPQDDFDMDSVYD